MSMSLYHAVSVIEGTDDECHDEDEQLEAFQYLIDTGACWMLQSSYGRQAEYLLDIGACRERMF